MKKIIVVCCGLLLCAALFAGCGSEQSNKNYSTLAQDFVEALYDADYATADTYLDADIKEYFTEDMMGQIKVDTESTYGKFEEVVSVESVDVEDYLELSGLNEAYSADEMDVDVEAVNISFADGGMVFYIMFEPSDRLILNVDVFGETEPASENSDGATAE